MDKVYLVLAIKNNAEVEASQLFLDEELALDRAYEVAVDIISRHIDNNVSAWLSAHPAKETLDDGSNRWIFLETSKQYVAVHLLPVQGVKSGFIKFGGEPVNTGTISQGTLPGRTDTSKLGGDLNDYIILGSSASSNLDDRYKKTSPGGFSVLGKAVNFEFLCTSPRDVLPTSDLSDAQRKALTIARINSITDYLCSWHSGLCWSRDHVKMYINSNNELANPIIDLECSFLDDAREEAIRNTEDYEDESSSSSEDEW